MADAFPISGNIDAKAFPFLVMDLHRNGATGSLKVEGPSYQKQLYYRSGRILFGSSNDPRDQLGAILIEGGKLTPEQLEDVTTKVGPGSPLAKVLADSGFVSQRELGEAARAKVERILSDVIAYDTGTFEFEDGVLPKGAVDLKLSTERLVLAAVRRIQDRGFALRHLGGLDAVLKAKPNAEPFVAEIRSETGGLTEQIDGTRTLKEAIAATRLDEFDAAKVACALLFLGIAERTSAEAGAPSAGGFDLGETARMALGDAPPVAAPSAATAPEDRGTNPAFFVPDDEPKAAPPEPDAFSFAEPPVPPPVGQEPAPELSFDAPLAPTIAMPPPIAAPPPPIVAAPPPEPAPPPRAPEPPKPAAPTVVAPLPPIPPPKSPSSTGATRALPLQPPPPKKPPAPEREPALMVPQTPSRPSKEDLAALDALLNSRSTEGPLEPLQKQPSRASQSAANWEPKFGQGAAAPERRGGPRRSGPSPVLLVALGLVLVVAAGGGWFYFAGGLPGLGKAGKASPAATPTAAPATTVAATASTTMPPPTTVVAAPSTTMAVAAPPTTTATAPKHGSTSGKTGRSADDAHGLMARGDLPEAARAFAASLRAGGGYSVQLLVACSAETVQKAVQNVSAPELYVLPVNYKGRDCYRLCWGVYDSETRAGAAVRTVPEYFVKGGASPKVVATSTILP